MPDTELPLAQRVGERIRQQIAEKEFSVANTDEMISVTVSIGVAGLLQPQDTVEALMKRADRALYEAKTGGRNRVVAPAA